MDVSDQLHAPAALAPGRAPDTYRIGGWMGPRAGLDTASQKEICAILINRNMATLRIFDITLEELFKESDSAVVELNHWTIYSLVYSYDYT
jgi:hypothetical protein